MIKPYKCRVEYLESDSTAYIDTGVSGANNNLKIEMGFSYSKFTAYGYLFSNYESEQHNTTRFLLDSSNNSQGLAYINTRSQNGAIYTSNLTIDTFHTFVLTKTSVSIDGNTTKNNNPPAGTANTKNIILFNRGAGTYYEKRDIGMRCYYFRIYDNDVLIRDFIPVLDTSGRPVMYDQVSGMVYENAGTGQFKIGPYKADNFNKKQLRKKLALMLANLKKKRKYYTEVEFIESTGTQYIDTGYSFVKSTDEIELYYMITEYGSGYSWGFGSLESGATYGFSGVNSTDGCRFSYGTTTANFSLDTQLTTQHYLVMNDGGMYNDNVQVKSGSGITINGTWNNFLFALSYNAQGGSSYYSKERIWRYTHKRNGVLIRDLIPVLDWDMTPCMYDKVSGELFYNAGTGDFSYGREIHYVEYLESTGTQYIDTGYSPSNTTGVEVRHTICTDNNSDNIIFGCRENSGDTRFWEDMDWTSTDTIGWGFNSYSNITPGIRFPISGMAGQTIVSSLNFMNDRAGSVNGVPYDTSLETKTLVTITRPICLFAADNAGTIRYFAACKIFNCQISEGSTVVRDFIPAIDENGVGFMFDRVSHTIYDNAGTGVFAYPPVELEYLQSTGTQYIDTGVVLSSTDKVEVSVEYTGTPTQGSSYAFGTFGSNKNFGINCTLLTNPKNWYGVWYNQGTLTSSSIFSDLNTRYDIQISSNGMYINDNLLTTVSGTFTGSVSAYLFWAHDTSQPKSLMKLYSCKMWQGGVLVRDFIPCYKDGVLGLFDKVNDVFYDNDGTGTFTTSKIVEPEYE